MVNLLEQHLFFPQRRFKVGLYLHTLGDIAGNGGGANDAAIAIFDGKNRQRNVQPLAVLAHPDGFDVLHALAFAQVGQNGRQFIRALRWHQQSDRLSNDLAGAIAIEPLRPCVPTRDHPR